jgi:hypothetical protein
VRKDLVQAGKFDEIAGLVRDTLALIQRIRSKA